MGSCIGSAPMVGVSFSVTAVPAITTGTGGGRCGDQARSTGRAKQWTSDGRLFIRPSFYKSILVGETNADVLKHVFGGVMYVRAYARLVGDCDIIIVFWTGRRVPSSENGAVSDMSCRSTYSSIGSGGAGCQ